MVPDLQQHKPNTWLASEETSRRYKTQKERDCTPGVRNFIHISLRKRGAPYPHSLKSTYEKFHNYYESTQVTKQITEAIPLTPSGV